MSRFRNISVGEYFRSNIPSRPLGIRLKPNEEIDILDRDDRFLQGDVDAGDLLVVASDRDLSIGLQEQLELIIVTGQLQSDLSTAELNIGQHTIRLDGVESAMCHEVLWGSEGAASAAKRPVFCAPANVQVVEVCLVNAAAVPSDVTNFMTLTVVKETGGPTILATFDGSTESFSAYVSVVKSLGSTSMNKGDVLSFDKVDSGTGAATTDLSVSISYKPV